MKGTVPGLLQSDTIMRKCSSHRGGPVPGRKRKLRIGHGFNCALLFKCDPQLFSWDIKQCSARLNTRSIEPTGLGDSRCGSEE